MVDVNQANPESDLSGQSPREAIVQVLLDERERLSGGIELERVAARIMEQLSRLGFVRVQALTPERLSDSDFIAGLRALQPKWDKVLEGGLTKPEDVK